MLIGRDGRMFYLGDDMVRQSAGLILRDQKVSEVADLLDQMKTELALRGVKLPRRHPAEFVQRLPGRSSTLGAEPRADD